MKNAQLLLSIVILFVLLWLPMGQYDFLLDHWMKIGTYAVPFLLMGAFTFYNENGGQTSEKNLRLYAIVMLIAYIAHQYEEHWLDLLGNYYAFYIYNNNLITGILGSTDPSIKPLTKASIFVINTSLVWLVACMAIWRSPRHIFPSVAMAGIIIVNGLVHILAGLVQWKYNPGLLTSIVIFLPLYLLFIKYLLSISKTYKVQIIMGLLWAWLAHVIMVLGLILANYYHYIPEWLYFVFLVLWSLLPLALYQKRN